MKELNTSYSTKSNDRSKKNDLLPTDFESQVMTTRWIGLEQFAKNY